MTMFPFSRPRRLRQTQWARELIREAVLLPSDFIYPIFITEGENISEPINGLDGQFRHSIDKALEKAREAQSLGIQLIALFPNTPQSLRDDTGSEALNPDCLVARAVSTFKNALPDLGIMVDIALDPYTNHGHDGLLINGLIDNDKTLTVLAEQALMLAKAGADVLSPSDMMDGRIKIIREQLEEAHLTDTLIFSYAAKYASCFYGPFREAVGASMTLNGDKKTYQMDPANGREALLECQMDIDEGADALIIKPGMPYLDIIAKAAEACNAPIIPYQVSGEYAMITSAAKAGHIDLGKARTESLLAFKRAGARAIISYFALEHLQ